MRICANTPINGGTNDLGWNDIFSGRQMSEIYYWFKQSYVGDNRIRLEDKFSQKNFALIR